MSVLSKVAPVVDRAGEEPLAQRAERHEADTELLECRQHLGLRPAGPQRVLALDGGHRLHGVRAANCPGGGLGQAEVAHLALRDQVLHGTGDVLDRHLGVDPVLVEEVDGVHAEPSERCLRDLADVLRAAVERRPLPVGGRIRGEAELGRDHHLPAERLQRLADQVLVVERPVGFGRVEEGDPALHRGPQERDHRASVGDGRVRLAHAHAPKADRGDLEAA